MQVVAQEAKAMQELPLEQPNEEINQVDSRDKTACYRCGYKGHLASACKYKSEKCHLCLKVGHLATVCHNMQVKQTSIKKGNGAKGAKSKGKHRGMNSKS